MNISELSLRRPVLATVMSIVIVIFGVVGYSFLGVREYPAIDPPIVTVRTNYTGANADIIESQITEPLEKSINGIQGVRTISSSSSVGQSNITVEFNLGTDLEDAANDVRDKVSQAQRNLPQDLDAPPVISKSDASGDFIIILAIQSKTMSLLELSDYAENDLAEQLQTIPEVSTINVFGSKKYAMRIWIDPAKLNAYSLTFQDVNNALQKENVELPSGKLYGEKTEITIRTMGRLITESDFANLILQQNENGIIRLSDVANVELGPEELERVYRLNGAYSIGLAVIPQPGANYITIADEFYKRLEDIKKTTTEKGIELTVTLDSTKNVRNAISEVKDTLLIAICLVILVIFLFFRNWQIALRPLIDIPISLIGAFFIMYLAGFSINVLTLLGIVLATGLVVDDGIVVTENIFRKLEAGMPVKKAALEGSKEIFFAVISTSITLAVVFMPVIFLEGFTGSLFREFGVVVAGAVLISAFVSLTITPVLNVYLNKKNAHEGWFYKKTEPFFTGMENGYKRLLSSFIKIRWAAIVIIIVCFGLMVLVYNNLQSELAPIEDRSNIRFSVSTPEGTSFEATSDFALQIENFLNDSIPEKQDVFAALPSFSATGVNSGFVRLMLPPPDERQRSQKEILNYINSNISQLNDGRIFGIEEQTISV
ncbi:MAG: efflux RND transporter permease subunit, partial [Fimbriimonadaceae bacterium]|nr:efflux RND transporter permease subunit [Chitinophagales bacterium]